MTLDFVDNKSVFREKIDRTNDSLKSVNGNPMNNMGFENQFYVKKDFKTNKVEKIIINSRLSYSLPISEKLNWKILPDKRKIFSYKTQKAEVNYGGRIWTAWFTTDLPVNDGPYIFKGLPGLIISIEDSNKEYQFDLIQVKKNGNLFETKTKYIEIDWRKYEYLAKSYYDDPLGMNDKIGKNVTFHDANGNQTDANYFKEFAKRIQTTILNNNNPIELTNKIKYK